MRRRCCLVGCCLVRPQAQLPYLLLALPAKQVRWQEWEGVAVQSPTHTHRIAFSLMESSHYSTQAPEMQKHQGCLFDRSLLPSPNGRQQKPVNPLHDPPLLEPAPAAHGFYVSRAVHSPIAAWASGTSTPSPHLPLPPAK